MDLPTEKENLFVVLLIRAPSYSEVGADGLPERFTVAGPWRSRICPARSSDLQGSRILWASGAIHTNRPRPRTTPRHQ